MRWGVFAALALWLVPVLSVGVHVFIPALAPALAIAGLTACAIAWPAAAVLAERLRPATASRIVATALIIVTGIAIAGIARVSVYMADPSRGDCSYAPADAFRTAHSCMTAYAEAAGFAAEGTRNIYDMALYEPRRIGPLKVDSYHYPPPFLLLPASIRVVRADVFEMRALWFTMQALVLAVTLLAVACWIGGQPGGYAIVGTAFAFATPQVIYSLQQGNFQSTAVPMAVAALLLLCTGRVWRGAPLLAFAAAAKIFPGVLVVYLITARRWRAVAITAAFAIALLGMTALAFGTKPLIDFIHDEMPRISNGASFPQSEFPDTVSSNYSVYGLTVRMRALGAGALTAPRGLAIASAYGVLIIGLAAFAGWRHRVVLDDSAGRARLAVLAVAIVSLASFRSPFVGIYGLLGTLWLMTLLAAGAGSVRSFLGSLALILLFCIATWAIPGPGHDLTAAGVGLSAALFVVALSVNTFAAVRLIGVTVPAARPTLQPT